MVKTTNQHIYIIIIYNYWLNCHIPCQFIHGLIKLWDYGRRYSPSTCHCRLQVRGFAWYHHHSILQGSLVLRLEASLFITAGSLPFGKQITWKKDRLKDNRIQSEDNRKFKICVLFIRQSRMLKYADMNYPHSDSATTASKWSCSPYWGQISSEQLAICWLSVGQARCWVGLPIDDWLVSSLFFSLAANQLKGKSHD